MKTKSMIFCVVAMVCISGSLVRAQDNSNQPMGMRVYAGGGGGMGGQMEGGMGGGMGMMPGMSAGGVGMDDQEFPKDTAASCLLKISCDPSILRLDYRVIKHLWFSTGVLNKAYRDVLKDPNLLDCSGYIFLLNDAGTPVDTMYSVAIPNGRKEKEILAAAVENLKSALSKLGDEERERLSDQLSQTDNLCAEAEGQMAQMQKQVRVITEQGVTNRGEVQAKISNLRDSMADISMRIQYCDLQISELKKQKDELQSTIEKALAGDTVVRELGNMVNGAQESAAIAVKLFNTGNASADKLQEANEKLARAKIELAKRIEEVRENAGQKKLAEIDGKIAAASSQISEIKLGNEYKSKESQLAKEFLGKCDELELLEMKLDAAKKSFYDVLTTRENLKARLQTTQKLSVSVIGMD
jgi:hypothetical protein